MNKGEIRGRECRLGRCLRLRKCGNRGGAVHMYPRASVGHLLFKRDVPMRIAHHVF